MLYIGEKVGAGGPRIDIALDPLEGTTITAKGGSNAGGDRHGGGRRISMRPTPMDKIAVGAGLLVGVVDLDATPEENLKNIAKAKEVDIAISSPASSTGRAIPSSSSNT